VSFETEFVPFLLTRPSVWNPIATAFSIVGSPTPPTDPRILNAVGYGYIAQPVPPPYFVWRGPFNFDAWDVSQGRLQGATLDVWLSTYCANLDDALTWISAIDADLASLWVPGFYQNLTTVRIMRMMYRKNSKVPIETPDESQIEGTQFPTRGYTISYKVWIQPIV
jgi:hypothetical protein